MTRKVPAAVLASIALVAAGCKSDDAAEKDIKDAAGEVEKAGEKVDNEAEKAIEGDSDGDGR